MRARGRNPDLPPWTSCRYSYGRRPIRLTLLGSVNSSVKYMQEFVQDTTILWVEVCKLSHISYLPSSGVFLFVRGLGFFLVFWFGFVLVWFFYTVLHGLVHGSRQAKLLARLTKNWSMVWTKLMTWNTEVMGYKVFPALSGSMSIKLIILNTREGKKLSPKLYSPVMKARSSQQKCLTLIPNSE